MQNKWRCKSCNEISDHRTLLRAPNPFDSGDVITGCPHCKQFEGFELLCDEDGCQEVYTSGWPSPEGYRVTCHKHWKQVI